MRFPSSRNLGMVAIFVLFSLSTRATAGPVFTFDDPSQGTSLVQTEGGLTVTFGSPAGPGGLMIGPGMLPAPFSGNALFNNVTSPNNNVPLTATFSKGVNGVSMDFAILDMTGAANTVTLQAFSGGLNGKLVGTVTATGIQEQVESSPNKSKVTQPFIGLSFPQGILSFSSSTPFDAIELTAGPGVSFAIDNLLVTVPEPAGLTLAGLALAAWRVRAWKRRAFPQKA
jgi:hypothetical protein